MVKTKTSPKRKSKSKLTHTKKHYRAFRKEIKAGARALERGDSKRHRKAVDSATNKALMFPIAFGKDVYQKFIGKTQANKKAPKKR